MDCSYNTSTFNAAVGSTNLNVRLNGSIIDSSMATNAANEHMFLVIVDGIIQDKSTWSISGTTLTLGVIWFK